MFHSSLNRLVLLLLVFNYACSGAPSPSTKIETSYSRAEYVSEYKGEPNLKAIWYGKPLYSFPERKHTWRVLIGLQSIRSYAQPDSYFYHKHSCKLSTSIEYVVSDIAPKHKKLKLEGPNGQNCGWFRAQDLILNRHPLIEDNRFVHFFPKKRAKYTLRSTNRVVNLDFHGFVIRKRKSVDKREYLVSPSPDLNEGKAMRKLGWVNEKDIFINHFTVVTSSDDDKEIAIKPNQRASYFRLSPLVSNKKEPVVILRKVLSSGYEVLINNDGYYSTAFITKRAISKDSLTYLPPLMKETKSFIELISNSLEQNKYDTLGQQLVQACSRHEVELQELASICKDKAIHDSVIQQRETEIQDFFADSSTVDSQDLGINKQTRQSILLYRKRIDLIKAVIKAINYSQYNHTSVYYE